MNKLTGVILSICGGVGMALQARINGELGRRIDDGIVAAVISFGAGLVLLIFAIPFMRKGLTSLRAALRDGSLLWWQCLGGACGALLVAAQGLTVASIGVAVFSVAVVAGQSASSLAVDRLGMLPGGSRPVTSNRAVGAILCVIAVVIAVGDRLGDVRALAFAALPALAGVAIAWQQGVNGLVRQAAGSALPAALVNFCAGTAALLIALTVDLAARGLPDRLPTELWLYTGGPVGITFIAIGAVVVARVGVLLMGMSMIAGQIVGSVVIDLVAPTASGPPTGQTLLGAALALAAISVAALPTSRRLLTRSRP